MQGLWKIQIITVIDTTDIFVQSQAWETKEYNIPVPNYALILPVWSHSASSYHITLFWNDCELAQGWFQWLDTVFMVKGASACKTRALSFIVCFEWNGYSESSSNCWMRSVIYCTGTCAVSIRFEIPNSPLIYNIPCLRKITLQFERRKAPPHGR